jgi:hypothetical protein
VLVAGEKKACGNDTIQVQARHLVKLNTRRYLRKVKLYSNHCGLSLSLNFESILLFLT